MSSIQAVLQFGWPYVRRYWTRLLVAVGCGLLFGLANGSFVWATRTITNRFSAQPRVEQSETRPAQRLPFFEHAKRWSIKLQEWVEPWLPRAGQPQDWRRIMGLVLLFPLLVGLRASSDYLSSYCTGWVGERVIRDMRLDLMEKLSSLSLDFFNRSTTGDLLTRINTDTANLLRALRTGGADLIKEPITVAVVLVYLCWIDWRLTLCASVLLPLGLFPLMVLGKKARRASRASLRASVSQSSQLVELLANIRVIKAFNLEEQELTRFRETSGQMVHAGMKGVQAKELVNPIIEVISMIGLGALILYTFQAGRSGADLTGFLAGLVLLFQPVRKLAALHIVFEQASIGVTRLREILHEEPKIKDPRQPKPLPKFTSAITFDRVSFAYGQKEVLTDFSVTVPRGLRLGLAGESGSGKTTVLNLLFRFYDPTRGAIRMDGLDLREVSVRALRQQMALVSQEIALFDQTVAENIACGKLGASRAEIEAAARAAFAHDFILELPQGYDTRVGERGVNLSGGQRQRIAIARAFIRDAPILVLDEATASLDAKSEGEVQAAIDHLAEHRTVICVAHRLATLAATDHILVLSQGRIVEQGSFHGLLQAEGPFAGMARRQGIRAPVQQPA